MGASSGAGAGTVAYENGVVVYTPTQAETDYTSVIFVAYKTGCLPACQSIVFSSAAVVGQVDVGEVNGTAQTAGDIIASIATIGSGTGAALNFAVSEDNASAPIKSVSSVGTQTGTYANTLPL